MYRQIFLISTVTHTFDRWGGIWLDRKLSAVIKAREDWQQSLNRRFWRLTSGLQRRGAQYCDRLLVSCVHAGHDMKMYQDNE